jgi:hypothetical protein
VTVHDFDDSLSYSHNQSGQPWWEDVYRRAFPLFDSMQDLRGDGWWQRAGIDRKINLTNSRSVLIDEKVRRRDYGDVLLEYVSNDATNAAGWIAKPLACDYIAYAFEPTCTCLLLPFQELRRAWDIHGRDWHRVYGGRRAKNNGYSTWSCPVPTDVLLDALRDSMVIGWEKEAA